MEATYQRVKRKFYGVCKGRKRILYKRVDDRFIKIFVSRACCKRKATWNAHYAHNFSALLQSLQSAFSKSSVSKIADAVVYMVLIIFALNSFMSL